MDNTPNSPVPQFIDANMIHQYFQKCGKIIKLEALKSLMTDCGDKLGLDDFHGDAEISFDLFYTFMTFMLEKKENFNESLVE